MIWKLNNPFTVLNYYKVEFCKYYDNRKDRINSIDSHNKLHPYGWSNKCMFIKIFIYQYCFSLFIRVHYDAFNLYWPPKAFSLEAKSLGDKCRALCWILELFWKVPDFSSASTIINDLSLSFLTSFYIWFVNQTT